MTALSSTNDDLFNLDLIRSYVDKEQNPRFVERQWLKEQVEEKLAEADCRFVLLTAEPGAGKSSFMAWLAHQHPDWCRYFIRRDQRTPLGDVGSYSFLLQVGFQLAATYPDLFKQEQIRIVVEQRIGTATNSEIVGAEIGKMFASPFYEKVIQIQQQVTHSKDTNITGVRVGEFYATERDLPLDNLQFMALFDPAKAMMKQIQEVTEHPNQQIVVLVDALDELRYQDSNLSLLKWLTNCPELPANLRFVLTCRPDDDLLRAFRGNQQGRIKEIEIAEEDPDVEKDLTQYTRFLIETTEVNQALIEMHQDIEKFTDRAVKKANGNFGYLGAIGRAVDEAIRQEQPDLLKTALDLAQLPNDLQDLYAYFLIKIKSTVDEQAIRVTDPQTGKKYFLEVWSEIYQPILGILSVAREPITIEQIQKFGDIPGDWQHLVGAIDRLRQFLDKIENRYRLYHSTLPEFFTSPETQTNYDYCYVDSVIQNRCILSHYQAGEKSWAEIDLRKIAEDSYGSSHLAQHLVKGDLVEELHELLSLDKDGKNAWFKVRDDEGDTAGFLADVRLAWELAEQNWTEATLPQVIGRQCRYALIISSINSLSDIPPELLEALVKAGKPYGWTPEQGLAYARQIPKASNRSRNLRILPKYLPKEHREEIWQECLAAAQTIQDEYYRVDFLSALAANCPTVYKEVLTFAQSISLISPILHASALSTLAANLPQDLDVYEEVLAAAQATQDEYYRAEILSALAANLPLDLYQEVLAAAQAMQDEYSRAKILSALAANLPLDLCAEVLAAAQAMQDESNRAEVLSALAAKSPEVYKEALTAAQAIQDESNRAKILSALATKFPEVYKEALTAAQAIQDESNRAKILSALAANLPLDLYEEVLAAAQAMQDESNRAEVLSALATNLPLDLYEEVLAAAQAIQGKYYRAKVLSALAANFPEVCKEALTAAQAIRDEYSRAEVLIALSANSPTAYEGALAAALAIQSEHNRAKFLSALAANFPEVRREALTATLAIQSEHKRTEVLSALATNLPQDLYEEVLAAALAMQDEHDRAKVLSALATNLPQDLYEEVLAAAQAIQRKDYRAEVLSALAAKFPKVYEEALAAALAIQNEHDRAKVLSELAADLPQDLYEEVLTAALAIQHHYLRAKVLSALAAKFPDAYEEALATALAIRHEYYRAEFLIALSANCPAAYEAALTAAQAIQFEHDRAEFLSDLATKFPEAFEEALVAAHAIHNESYRTKVLNYLIPLCSEFPIPRQFTIWQKFLRTVSQHKRPEFLFSLAASVPLIDSLGKKVAGVAVAETIQQIAKWWK